MGATRIIDYIFRTLKDGVSPKFKALEGAENRFHRQSAKGWQQNESRGKQSISSLGRHTQQEFGLMGGHAAALGSQIARAFSAIAIGAAVKKSFSGLADLGDQMTGIAIKLNEPVEKLESVRRELLAFSQQPGITDSAEGMARAVNTLVGADFSLAESMKIAMAAAKGAAAAQTDTATVTRGLTSILKGFRKEASQSEEVLSKMIRAADLGVVEMEDLSNAMVDLVAPSLQAGASIEQVLGMLETLSVSGVANAAEASTAIARMLERFAQPDFRKKSLRFGIRVTDEKGNLKSPVAILEMIRQKYKSLDNDIKRSNFIEKITGGEIRTKRALIPLLENLTKVKEAVGDIEQAGGRLDAAFAESTKRLSAKFAQFKNVMTDAGMAFVEAAVPAIDKLSAAWEKAFPAKDGGLAEVVRNGMEKWSGKSWVDLAAEGVLKNPAFLAPSILARGMMDKGKALREERSGPAWHEAQPPWREIPRDLSRSSGPALLQPKITIHNQIDAATGKTRTDVTVSDPSDWERRMPVGP